MAVITDIADAVVTELNGHTFSQPLAAVRYYTPHRADRLHHPDHG